MSLYSYIFYTGDVVGLELEVFEKRMSVALFSKNNIPVGTRFLTLKKHKHFFPTIAICGNGCDVLVDVVWQNRVASPPLFSVVSIVFNKLKLKSRWPPVLSLVWEVCLQPSVFEMTPWFGGIPTM